MEETAAFGAIFVRSLGGDGEAEIGRRRERKVAERCVEMADAGGVTLSASLVTGRFGRFAADRKAPRVTSFWNSSHLEGQGDNTLF